MSRRERLDFFLQWIGNPLQVASITPSSRSLSEIITGRIRPDHAPIIELGPGTGVFTRALLERGIPEERLALIEYGSDFARLLDMKFPKARVLWMDAATLPSVALFEQKAGAVVSGLPLLSMPHKKIEAILSGAFFHMRSGASFYQFTYGYRCPVPAGVLERLALKAVRIGGTLANLPPAAVYQISRRGPQEPYF